MNTRFASMQYSAPYVGSDSVQSWNKKKLRKSDKMTQVLNNPIFIEHKKTAKTKDKEKQIIGI